MKVCLRALRGAVVRGLCALAVLLVASPALANHYRYGLFVGNNDGLSSDPPLMFAASDAEKMRDLFVEYGEMRPADTELVLDGTARQVQAALDRLSAKIRQNHDEGHETSLVFYYSGHGDAVALHLGSSRIEHVNLRTWLENSGADVRLAFIDACQSGGLLRKKGGTRGPAMAFAVAVDDTRGTAILTSSAASELSQESVQVGGGFFTHYLHTALTGGADRNRDGVVTLTEANAYVHTETAFGTRDAPGSQTPRFDFDMVGSGDFVLTQLEEATSHLAFLGELEGTFAIWDESRKRYVAEVNGSSEAEIAIRPGTYYVHRRMPGWVDEARYAVRRGETRSVFEEDFTSVSYESVASRGDLERVARRARFPDLTVRLVMGARGFGANSVWAQEYVPGHAVGGIEARFISQRSPYWGFDLLTGAATETLDFGEVGGVPVRVSSTSGGVNAGFATGPRLVRAGLGGKAEIIGFSRAFPDRDLDVQRSVALAGGGAAWVGLHHGRFTGDLQLATLMLFQRWDEQPGWPTVAEITLQLGYRF